MSRWKTEACWLAPAQGETDAAEPLARFEAWCAAHAGSRCVVWLGSALLLPLLVGPDLPLRDDAALRAWARRVLSHYGVAGDAPLATWRSGRRLGVVALEGFDLAAARAVAARHRVRLAGVRPGWALALHRLRRGDRSLARGRRRVWLREPGLATALTLEDGALQAIEARWTHAGDDAVPSPGEPTFDVAGAMAPFTGPTAPDFLSPPVRREAAAGWALAATGALVLGVALFDAGLLSAAPVAAVQAVPDSPTNARESATWAARAGHPWPQIFGATDGASLPGVHWLQLEHDAARGSLRLTGQAADVALALAAAERLAAAPALRDALLAHSEPVAAGGSGVRFELQARLPEAAR